MNAALRLAYGAAGQLARAFAVLTPPGTGKVRRSLSARRGIRERYRAFASRRDASRPLLWMHAPSVGEGLQARVVLERIRERHPEVQLAYSFFSPSAEPMARGFDVDFTDYLPFDTRGDARATLAALRPTALVFAKLDVWPTLVDEAHGQGVPLGMISATLAPRSSRRGSWAVPFLHEAYARLDAVGAVSDEDARRLVELGVRQAAILVTGDTRFDQVLRRAARVDRQEPMLLRLTTKRPTVVAGSTWPTDEEVLFEAWTNVRGEVPLARLIIAPHEPAPEHLATIEQRAADIGLRLNRLDDATEATDVVLVDRVGVLGDLYALADAAFVGGGFHSAGLHSVLEPAAYGVPVAFGLQHGNSRDAALLIRARGADAVGSADELTEALVHWLGDASQRSETGARARQVVESGAGATEKSVDMLMHLMHEPPT